MKLIFFPVRSTHEHKLPFITHNITYFDYVCNHNEYGYFRYHCLLYRCKSCVYIPVLYVYMSVCPIARHIV